MIISKIQYWGLLAAILFIVSCKSNDPSPSTGIVPVTTTTGTTTDTDTTWKTQEILDDYTSLYSFSNYKKWGSYNVHDPAIIKEGDWYYIFSTDVMYGIGDLPRVGIQVRKSQDLVHWKFVGWAFGGIPSDASSYVKTQNDGTSPSNIWAPYAIKVGDTFRLYYAVSVFGSNASYIGLATSTSLEGPWTQKGAVVKTTKSDNMNAIDPTVTTDVSTGEQWMAYGSFWNGIYVVQLDPETGLTKTTNDKGKNIARNGQSGDALEAPELIYNAAFQKYYLFVSYNDLSTNYNVRVGRSDTPDGPFLDMFGTDMIDKTDNWPVLTSPYQFSNHSGWQGVGHCGAVSNGTDFFVVHQGRLGANPALMDLHVRKILWTEDGWPSFSPERFHNLTQTSITNDSITGTWEEIVLDPSIGQYDKNQSAQVKYASDGTLTSVSGASWQLNNTTLTVQKNSGTVSLHLMREWDWENERETFIYTGLNSAGKSVWGKKVK